MASSQKRARKTEVCVFCRATSSDAANNMRVLVKVATEQGEQHCICSVPNGIGCHEFILQCMHWLELGELVSLFRNADGSFKAGFESGLKNLQLGRKDFYEESVNRTVGQRIKMEDYCAIVSETDFPTVFLKPVRKNIHLMSKLSSVPKPTSPLDWN
jgi:hypothetical protein